MVWLKFEPFFYSNIQGCDYYRRNNPERRTHKQPNMQSDRSTNREGYIITMCPSDDGPFIRNALHVEMDTHRWIYDDDNAAARAAQRDGIKLVYGIPCVADGVYLDTPENRAVLEAYRARMEIAIRNKRKRAA